MQSIASTANTGLKHLAMDQSRVQRFALLGILTAVIGTGCAVVLIPSDPIPRGALFDAAVAMTTGLIVAPIAAAFRCPQSLFRAENLVSLAPIYWLLLDLLQSAYPLEGVSPEHVKTAFLTIGVFTMAMWAGTYSRPWRFPQSILKSASLDISGDTMFRISLAAFVFGMLKFAIPTNFNFFEMFSYIGRGRWAAPWGRGQLGGWDAFQDQLQYFGYLLPAITVVVARSFGWLDIKTLFSAFLSIIMTLFLMQGGGRRIIGMIFGIALIFWVLTQQRLRMRSMILALLSVAFLLVTLQIMLKYRNAGLRVVINGEQSEPVLESDYLHVDDNFLRLSQTIALIPDYYPYLSYRYLVWVLVRPVPRVFWPGKPIDPGFDLPSVLGLKGVSLTSSVIGELYMSAGFLAVIVGGWFFGRLSRMVSQLFSRGCKSSALIIYAIMTMALFVGFRSMLELVLMNYALVAWVGLSLVYDRFKGKQAT
jgi:oligosaccharide repeat unit polymerase